MNVHEALSRLQAGELPPDEADALRARIAREPEVRAAWELLEALPATFEDLLHTPPPPGLDDRILGAPRRSWRPLAVGLLAVAAVLAVVLGGRRAPVTLVVSDGSVEVDGRARVLAGAVQVDVDGSAEISVEPADGPARGTEAGGPMTRRSVVAGSVLVAVVVGTATVRAGGSETVLVAGESTRVGDGAEAPVPSGPSEGPPNDLLRRNAELEAENRLLQNLLQNQEIETSGTPIPWTDDIPAAYRPEAFERNVREAVATCAPNVEIVGFACSEPPCLVLLRPPGPASGDGPTWYDALVNTCPAWVDRYTSSVDSANGVATCPDGTEESYHLLGASYTLADPSRTFTREEQENRSKRFQARIREIKANWACRAR